MSGRADRTMIRRAALVSLGLLMVFLAGWQWGPKLLGIPQFIIPPLSMVFEEFLRMLSLNNLMMHTGVTADLVASIGLFGWSEIGIGLPIHMVYSGDTFTSGNALLDANAGVGDLRLVPKFATS